MQDSNQGSLKTLNRQGGHRWVIVLFHNYFPPSGEQPEQGWIAIFHKYCCYTKHGAITTNLTLCNPCGYITDMSKYHNAGIWNIDKNISHFMFKNKYHLWQSVLTPPLVRYKPLGAPAFVRLVYCTLPLYHDIIIYQCPNLNAVLAHLCYEQNRPQVHKAWRDTQMSRFMGPTWSQPGPCRPQVGPMKLPIWVCK